MKLINSIFIMASILFSPLSFASEKHEEGEKLYKSNCAVCHGSSGGMDFTKRLAPPIAAVRLHYIDVYPDKENFVTAVTEWVEKPNANKTLMQGAIRRFNMMPPLTINKEDSLKIAEYIYAGDIEELEGYKEHVEEEHGKEGKMHDQHGKKGQGKAHKKDKGSGSNKMIQKLALTSEQQSQLSALKAERKAILEPLKKELKQIKKSIKSLDTASPTYKADIFSLADKQAALVHRIVIEKGEMKFKIDSILTPEQRSQVNSMGKHHEKGKHRKNKNKEHRMKHEKRHEKGHGKGHGKMHSQSEMN